jgi:polyhydroxyalkanoate synthesis repressor PhaR
MAERKAVIKKYSDRRLYDSGARRYVNLDDIARMVREGVEVEVLDAGTGKDLTRIVLTQIIMEDIRDGESGLPLKLLNQLVVASDRATHDVLSWYLENAAELSKKAGGVLRSGVSEARSAVAGPMEFVRNLLGAAPPPPESDNKELDALREEIQELKTLLAQRDRSNAAAKPKRRAPATPARSRGKKK